MWNGDGKYYTILAQILTLIVSINIINAKKYLKKIKQALK